MSVAGGSQQSQEDARAERKGLYVAVAVFFSASVLIRWAAETLTSYEIAFGRMLTAGIAVMGLALVRRERLPRRGDRALFAAIGLIAALHFGLYIASLSYTSIAHSLALVYTAPIFVAIFSWLFLKEGMSRRKWLGTLVAVVGGRSWPGSSRLIGACSGATCWRGERSASALQRGGTEPAQPLQPLC